MKNSDIDAKAINKQIGGNHYKNMAIQPIEYAMRNNLNALEHSVLKYISRRKSDRIEDLRKAIHCLELLIEFEDEKEKKDELNLVNAVINKQNK